MNRQYFNFRVIAIVSLFCLLAGCAAPGPGNRRSRIEADAFVTQRTATLQAEGVFVSPELTRVTASLTELERAVRDSGELEGARYTVGEYAPGLLVWSEHDTGRDHYVILPLPGGGYRFLAASGRVRGVVGTQVEHCEHLLPLHLLPERSYSHTEVLVFSGERMQLSPVTLEDGTEVTDLYPLFVEFYERSGLYEVTEEGEGVFTAKLTYAADSTQPALRFAFRADDSGRSVTVDFA